MNKVRFTLCAFTLLALSVTCASVARAQASRVYVSANKGEDFYPCWPTAPCQTIQVGIANVAAGGEVVVLDSGSYQPFLVNKSVTIATAPGVNAGITASSSNAVAVRINAGPSDTVVIRGLTLNGLGTGSAGIDFETGKALHVENCVISGFSTGINFDAAGQILVKDTFVRHNRGDGIIVTTTTGTATASIDHCRLEGNGASGLHAGSNSRVTIRDSVAANNRNGFYGSAGSPGAGRSIITRLHIEDCVATGNSSNGIEASGSGRTDGGQASVSVANSAVTNNDVGLLVDDSSFITVANTTIAYNNTGVFVEFVNISSFGDNKLFGNGTNGAFPATVVKQ